MFLMSPVVYEGMNNSSRKMRRGLSIGDGKPRASRNFCSDSGVKPTNRRGRVGRTRVAAENPPFAVNSLFIDPPQFSIAEGQRGGGKAKVETSMRGGGTELEPVSGQNRFPGHMN
jgi:hypothetical protein